MSVFRYEENSKTYEYSKILVPFLERAYLLPTALLLADASLL